MMLPLFLGLGYRSFSIPPHKIEEMNYLLSLVDTKECQRLVEDLRDPETGAATAEEVWERLLNFQAKLQLR
ncbi:MAG: hypothetical protein EBZ48_03505 [Proteobacteria bacterium]|nr:hypothetical protein [Pseudomonadota bacterium]